MSGIDKIILKSENIDLSGDDILRITDNKCHILTYSDLENVQDLNTLFNPFNAVILLYETKKNFGHWVSLLKINENTIEFFDPYGLAPDEELKIIEETTRNINGKIVPHLTQLINESNYKLIYNKQQIQKFLEHVNTCGRYCATRVRFSDVPLRKFIDFLTKNKYYDADFFVSALTLLV
jgi:hypothetical protein